MIYLLFFLSGLSGLVYQVVWVRVFGNVFGNTIHSASLVVAVFMLGLGVGSYVVGAWADRRYVNRPDSLLRSYGNFEMAIAVMGLAIAIALPHLGTVSALASSYVREPNGWYGLSSMSYLGRAAITVVLLTPITIVMGGTLTLLIRHLVRSDPEVDGWRIAVLYGINTAGAAAGSILTDFYFVPAAGLWTTQMVAVCLNVLAGIGAWYLARQRKVTRAVRVKPDTTPAKLRRARVRSVRLQPDQGSVRLQPDQVRTAPLQPGDAGVPTATEPLANRPVILTSVALALIGFAALGMEIVWFRHFSILLGGFRAVFSLLLTLILAGIAIGSLAAGALERRAGRNAEWLMAVQTLFVIATLAGVAIADVGPINSSPASGLDPTGGAAAPAVGALAELWFNLKPMLPEIAMPALLMGFSFPLANALIQHAEQAVGRRAGILYLANTAGAVCGSIATGFVLLPMAGLQLSTTVLAVVAGAAIVPLFFAAPGSGKVAAASLATAAVALAAWLQLPSDHVTQRALGPPREGERRLIVNDGLTELIAVNESSSGGRTLVTNGHAMSSTLPLSQRYMRALAHIPLLSMARPEAVLVIGFGVGNTTHAATLHPSVQRVELADLSRDILEHASFFDDANRQVLSNPKVAVHINDGRQHLQMQPPGSYDLVVLEPPPIAYAGVSALYSREFYALARSRLRANGYVSQWLPTYQVPQETALSMVRAFVDVFPESVLLSGAESDLLLLGTTASRIEIDPDRVAARLASAPDVRADLERISLGRPRDIVGTFVGSAPTLIDATRDAAPVIDDRPLQEYGVRSMLNFGHGVPESVGDLTRVGDWCPRCFEGGAPAPAVEDLDTYFDLITLAYGASRADVARVRQEWTTRGRVIAGSSYLGAIVPESAETHNVLGVSLARKGQIDAAIVEFREAIRLEADDPAAHWHLGAALASKDETAEATRHLARAVELDPQNGQARNDLGFMLAVQGRYAEALEHLRQAVTLAPQSVEARRNLELVLERQRVPSKP